MSIVPVLPTALLELIESPVPIIAGITNKQYKVINSILSQNEKQDKIWVNCNTG